MTLPRGKEDSLVLTVYALPLGFEERAEGYFPSPVPPRQFVKGPGGRVLRDPKHKNVLLEPNEDDPGYAAEARKVSRMQMVVWLYESIKRGNVEFVTAEPDSNAPTGAWTVFYEAIYGELVKAGFTIGDLNLLFKEVSSISNLSDDVIGDAAEDFLPEEEEGPVGMD